MQRESTVAESEHTDTGHIKKVMMGSAAGTIVEWFDFALFGYMAVYIAQNFFPSEDKMAGLLQRAGFNRFTKIGRGHHYDVFAERA